MKKFTIDKDTYYINLEEVNKVYINSNLNKELIFKNVNQKIKSKFNLNKISDLYNLINLNGACIEKVEKSKIDLLTIQHKLKTIAGTLKYRGTKFTIDLLKIKIKENKINLLTTHIDDIIKKLEFKEGVSIIKDTIKFSVEKDVLKVLEKEKELSMWIVNLEKNKNITSVTLKIPVYKSFSIIDKLEVKYKLFIDNFINE